MGNGVMNHLTFVGLTVLLDILRIQGPDEEGSPAIPIWSFVQHNINVHETG